MQNLGDLSDLATNEDGDAQLDDDGTAILLTHIVPQTPLLSVCVVHNYKNAALLVCRP